MMAMNPTGELSERVERLECEVRRSKRIGRVLVTCLALMAVATGANFANQRIDLKDDEGRTGITIGNFVADDSTRDIIVRDLNGKNRIAIGVDNQGSAYINVFGKNGQIFKNLVTVPNSAT